MISYLDRLFEEELPLLFRSAVIGMVHLQLCKFLRIKMAYASSSQSVFPLRLLGLNNSIAKGYNDYLLIYKILRLEGVSHISTYSREHPIAMCETIRSDPYVMQLDILRLSRYWRRTVLFSALLQIYYLSHRTHFYLWWYRYGPMHALVRVSLCGIFSLVVSCAVY